MDFVAFLLLTILLSFMDISYTYTNVKILKEYDVDWKKTEYNPIVRSAWQRFGMVKGTLIAGAGTLVVMVLITFVIGENEFFQGAIIGIFLMIHHLHYVNFAIISKKYRNKELPLLSRIIMEW